MQSTDTNLKMYISEEERAKLFCKMQQFENPSELLSAEYLEQICLGSTHLADYAYGQIRRLLKQEYKQWQKSSLMIGTREKQKVFLGLEIIYHSK